MTTMQLEGLSEQAIAELVALYRKDGHLTPAMVVEWANTHPDSALHAEFEWDDQLAANEWRLAQARRLVAAVKVRIVEHPAVATRAFVSIQAGDSRRYVMADQAANDEAVRAETVRRLNAQLGQLMNKLRRFEEFAEIVRTWDATVEDGQ